MCLFLFSVHVANIDEEREAKRDAKRRASSDALLKIGQSYPDHFEEFTTLTKERGDLLVQVNVLKDQVSQLGNTVKAFADTGSCAIIRSFYEIVIANYRNQLWQLARSLWIWVFQAEWFGDVNVLGDLPNDIDLMALQFTYEGKTVIIPPEYKSNAKSVIFLRTLTGMPEKEKKEEFRTHFAYNTPEVVDTLENSTKIHPDVVRESLAGIYKTLCYDDHQSGARFEGACDFILPKANSVRSIATIYAFATIVKVAGLNPIYPTPIASCNISCFYVVPYDPKYSQAT
jgi:hypothetical protein